MIISILKNITEEKRTSLRVGSSGFISLNPLKTFFLLSSVSDVLMMKIHLNLPTNIYFANGNGIEYFYNAAGQKIRKKVYDMTAPPSGTIKDVDYLDGFQYAGGVLQFFPTAEGYVSATLSAASIGSSSNYIYNYVYNHTDHLGNIRLSYTKDPVSGEIEILEENHYYPFGLKHTAYSTGIKQQYELVENMENVARPGYVYQTDYQYKYNGKELQDELGLNLYDYGARNYDAALGRFFNLDRLSEKYEAISPYGYVANNPVRYIDINGEWIYIEDGENKYRYQNGQTQHQVDGEWTTIDETVNLSDYVVGMVTELNTLENSGKTGAGLIGDFSNDKNNVTIMSGSNNEYNNGIITYNLDNNAKVFTQDGYTDMPHYVGIGHELGHAKDPNNYYSGLGGEWYAGVSKSEIYASHIENMIRAESGLSLRTHYGGITNSAGDRILPNPASALIDKRGNSIFYTWDGKQRDFNLSIGISKAVYGGEIIKSRMKVNVGGKQAEVRGFPYNYSNQNGKK